MDPFEIRVDDLSGPEIAALLSEHLQSMVEVSPADGVHALDLDGLRAPEVTFWSVWSGTELVGCGALKELDPTHGELKSMRTATTHRRRGVARTLLSHMIEVAQERGYRWLSLETGSGSPFEPAHAFYRRFGFERCSAFADYEENSFSVFMTRSLDAAP